MVYKLINALLFVIFLAFISYSCVPLDQQGYARTADKPYYASKQLKYEDATYEDKIKTVVLYPETQVENDMLGIPVISRQKEIPLILTFDELGNQYQNYYARIIHCNADWTPSMLNDIEFLNEFNEYPITEYEISINTRVPYMHYRFKIPRVKVSGNYVVMVYRNTNREDFILTRRFMVYDNLVTIMAEAKFSTGVQERYTNQQVDFTVDYSRYNKIINPVQEVKVVLRQNNRWDNAITNLTPLFVRDDRKRLEYNYFNLENNFKGGNEFRIFDIRSIRFLRVGMKSVQPFDNKIEVEMLTDVSRNKEVYTQLVDINGKFVIEHYETRRGPTESDYVWTNFELASPAPVPGNVYLFGAFSDWKLKKDFQMTYDEVSNKYKGRVLLKQGYYNYIYKVEPAAKSNVNELHFEGSYNTTENFYDILVYYRPIGGRADQLIGYTSLNFFGR